MSFAVLETGPERLEASPGRLYRRWSLEAKARIVAESLAPGAVVVDVARAHQVSASQIYDWRRQALERIAEVDGGATLARQKTLSLEIAIGDVTIRVGGDIGEEQLRRVLRAVRAA